MFDKKRTVLGIIAARGGSKRILRKNIRQIASNPLIYYTITAVKASQLVTHLILSSDDEEIIQYAESHGVDVPFIRPSELASDMAQSVDVILHALDFMENEKQMNFDYVSLFEPTSPLRNTYEIDQAIQQLIDSDFDSVISLVPASTPYRIRYVQNGEVILPFKEQFFSYMKNKSQYPKACLPGGGIFCAKTTAIRKEKVISPGRTLPYIMDSKKGLDINTEDDFFIAECLLLREKNRIKDKDT